MNRSITVERRGMKIYIAAPFPAWRYAQFVALFLKGHGHVITSTWHDVDAPNGGNSDEVDAAKHDLAEIDAADALVLLNGPLGQGGRHFETGYAFAAGKYVCVFGEGENIFHALITKFSRAEDLAIGLKAANAR